MEKIKLTKTVVAKLPFAEKGKQIDYWDSELKGFGCRVSSSAKTFFIMRRVNGKLTRVSIGRHGIIAADKAREEALKSLGKLSDGVDINKEKAKARVRGITLQKVHDEYLIARPQMKQHSITVDKSLLKCHMSDWLSKPIQEVTRDMIAKRHLKIAKDSGENTANNAMRLFRRLYNFALSLSDGDMAPNPVLRLSDSRQWFKVSRRQTVLKDHELPYWYSAVQNLENPIIADYLLLLLLTGLRKNEAISLRWQNIDMKDRSFVIPAEVTKNRKPHPLPMSDLLFELFQRRLDQRENEYVFPGSGKKGHLIEPKKQVAAIERETKKTVNGVDNEEALEQLAKKYPDKVKPGIRFCLHDLRRTFASVAESVVSYSVLKRLMNHTDKDVTQGYIVLGVDKLRVSMQMVTDTIKAAAKISEPGH